jgi:hypothetical protein
MARPAANTNWVADLAFEAALGYFSEEELLTKFELTPEKLRAVQVMPEFRKAVTAYRREIDEDGTEFKLKARKLASELLPELAVIAADDTASHADRISAIREMCRLAGYGKENEPNVSGNMAFQVNINLGAT